MFWLRFPSFFCLKGFSDLIFWAWEGRKIWLYPIRRMDEFPKVSHFYTRPWSIKCNYFSPNTSDIKETPLGGSDSIKFFILPSDMVLGLRVLLFKTFYWRLTA